MNPPDQSSGDATGSTPKLKDKMCAWSEQHPEEAARRLAARDASRKRKAAAVKLSELIGEDMIQKAAGVLNDQLEATTAVVVPVGQGEGEIEFVPDNRARLEAVKIVAAYTEGTPVARVAVMHADFKDLDAEKRAVLMGSSAVQEALADMDESEELTWQS